MQASALAQEQRKGILFAVAAALLWSGNFIVARGIINQVPPVTLSFFRWLTAMVLLLPIAWPKVRQDWPQLKSRLPYLFWTALTGIAVFNTLVYVAGHYSPAINLALIGTTSSPFFALLLAAIFLKERIAPLRLAGMALSFAGVVLLLSKGSWEVLRHFRFAAGDVWVMAAAFSFAVYTILVRRKPKELQSISFLWTIFAMGTLMLLPVYIWEKGTQPAVQWTPGLAAVILYLGLGASVIAFLIWNLAIGRLGAGRTAVFGNLIPLFSTLEAVAILGEPVQTIHLWSGLLIMAGLILANSKKAAA
ncbi:DMT family transporter [Pseudocnuella soli]|uniref:DMT family transporter n=1 Tax=Pseudocnuella soli TaxID=2502779 RepID=UPI001052AD20|nr:DMT family transporter [Pseudocnuella soli]